jgi:DNA gyrase subunit A
MIKKISVADLPGPSSQAHSVMNVAEGDSLVGARLTTGADEILLVTSGGRAIRFKEEEVRAMGLAAQGVMGIKPGGHDDRVIGFDVVDPRGEAFLITDAGMGKRTPLKDFPSQGRYGVGVTAAALAGRQRLVGMCVGEPSERVVLVTSKGTARAMKLDAAGRRARGARGAGIVKLKDNETVVRVVPALAQISLPEPEPAPEATKAKPRAGAKRADRPAPRAKARPAPRRATKASSRSKRSAGKTRRKK